MDAWCRYVKAAVTHYKGRIVMYEIWNEPDGNKNNTPEDFARFIIRTAEVIRSCDPDVRIAAFGITKLLKEKREWLATALDVLRDSRG